MRSQLFIVLAASLAGPSAAAQHSTLGAGPERLARTAGARDVGPSDLSEPSWTFPASDPAVSGPIRFVGESGPVVARQLVVAVSRQDGEGSPARIWAIDREDGTRVWQQTLPDQVFDSWSSPTIDRGNGTVLYATASQDGTAGVLQARRLTDGALAWQTELEKIVVNATPLVTTDRGPRDRAFITDFEGFFDGGAGGILYAINVDPFDAQDNPFQPGEIVYQAALNDGSSGNTPAYDGERVYVASAGNFNAGTGGSVFAFDPAATDASDAPLWQTSVGGHDGFFGGVSVLGGFAYAATFNFAGGFSSSRLFKLEADTGAIVYSTASNRTSSIPIPLSDGRIALSTGLPTEGSVPSLQLYQDDGDSASLLDDTAFATFDDDNGNGFIDSGEFEIFGGYHHQPHVVDQHPATGGRAAYVGSVNIAGTFFNGYDRISLIDLTRSFDDPGLVITSYEGAGSSPAVAGRTLYTLGIDRLVGFGEFIPSDEDGSGAVDFFDLTLLLRSADTGRPEADVDLDGDFDAADVRTFVERAEGAEP